MDMSLSKLLEVEMYREAWRAAVHGVPKSWTRLSDRTTTATDEKIIDLRLLWWVSRWLSPSLVSASPSGPSAFPPHPLPLSDHTLASDPLSAFSG